MAPRHGNYREVRPQQPRPHVGISACLMGQAVRYDGRHKYLPTIETLTDQLQLLPVCPEIAIGLGVPRAPIRLEEIKGVQYVRGVDKAARDVGAALAAQALQLPADLCGFILKAKSPSCGLGSTPLWRDNIIISEHRDGAFATALKQRLPYLPLIDDVNLRQPAARAAFIDAVHRYAALLNEGDPNG